MRRTRILLGATGIAATIAMLAACTSTGDGGAATKGTDVFDTAHIDGLVAAMPQESLAPTPTMRLAADLLPPTNRWFSGLVFGEQPQPVFPLPLGFALTDTGFAFGVGKVATSSDLIASAFTPAVTMDLGADSAVVSDYSPVAVTIEHAAGDVLGHTVIAEGSPFVGYTAATAQTLQLPAGMTQASKGLWTVQLGGRGYGVTSNATIVDSTVTLTEGQTVTWFAVPDGGDAAALAALGADPLVTVTTGYELGSDSARTTLDYVTANGGATAVAALPHQLAGLSGACELGTYPSILGTMSLCETSELSWSVPRQQPDSALDLSGIGDAERDTLLEFLDEDAATLETLAADTYFGGKSLYRLANLVQLARQLESPREQELTAVLVENLRLWADPRGCDTMSERCFVYDPTLGGMVGKVASFGSDEFNDHHFHYGYFLYAAGVAAQNQPGLAAELAPVIDLLAADIANGEGTASFPERRVFDPYRGHSWASGYSPFADGNNQESSAEAVMAWTGLSLWAQASGNAGLETEADWMMSAEAASALAYWTNFDAADPVYHGYDHRIVSLNWGAKRDYATWFSAESNAKLGILLLPMGPFSRYLGGDRDRVIQNVQEAAPAGFTVQFSDYLIMYLAMAGGSSYDEALAAAEELPDELIDDGNSRSYLMAWMYSRG